MTFAAVLALVLAAPSVSLGPPPPVLIMVRMNGSAAFEQSQTRLHDELTLLLDGFMIMSTPVEVDDFPRKPLAEQLAAVLPMSRANDAVAVVWMAEPMSGQLMLHLVAMGTGRTLVRTIDFDRKSRSESALALMLRELLGTAFLYEKPKALPAEVRTVVREVRTQMSQSPEVAVPAGSTALKEQPELKEQPAPPRLRLAAAGLLQAGVIDQLMSTARFGGSLSASVRAGPVSLGAEAGVVTVRTRIAADASVNATSLTLDATVAKHFGEGSFLVGPRLALGFERSWTQVTGASIFVAAGGRGSVGLEALGGPGPWRWLARLELEGRLRRAEVAEITSETVVWRLPAGSLKASLGISWEGF